MFSKWSETSVFPPHLEFYSTAWSWLFDIIHLWVALKLHTLLRVHIFLRWKIPSVFPVFSVYFSPVFDESCCVPAKAFPLVRLGTKIMCPTYLKCKAAWIIAIIIMWHSPPFCEHRTYMRQDDRYTQRRKVGADSDSIMMLLEMLLVFLLLSWCLVSSPHLCQYEVSNYLLGVILNPA